MKDNCSPETCSIAEHEDGIRLWEKVRQGDKEATSEMVRRYRDDLLFFVNSYVHNLSIAEDIVSDAFLRLMMNMGKFRGESSLKTYLYRIAANRAKDELRRAYRRNEVHFEDYQALADDEKTLESLVLEDERKVFLHRAMQKLHEGYRQVLFLSYFEFLSVKEVACVMGKSRKQTENLLYRAKLALKNALEKEGYSHENL